MIVCEVMACSEGKAFSEVVLEVFIDRTVYRAW